MSEQCCVIGCPNGTVGSSSKFYRFPKDKGILEEWKSVLKIKRPLSHYRVCGLHFTDSDFKLTNLGWKVLGQKVVPSLNLPEVKMECLQESDLGQKSVNANRATSYKKTWDSTDKPSLQCHICEEPAKDRMILLFHLAQHRFGLRPVPRRFSSVTIGPDPFFCILCGNTFPTRNDLQFHMKKRHHSSGKSNRCETCCRNFHSLAALKIHVEVVHLANKFLCLECDRIFSSVTEMHLHSLSHGSSWECPECCLHLEELSTLSSHLDCHVPVSFYSCNYCNLIFSSQGSVLAHLLTHTSSLEPADCFFCSNMDMPFTDTLQGFHVHEISSMRVLNQKKRRKSHGQNLKSDILPSQVLTQSHSSMDPPASDETGDRHERSLQGCSTEISCTSNASNTVSETTHIKTEFPDCETESPDNAFVNITHHQVSLKCEDCNQTFLDDKEFSHHKNLHRMKGDFSCIECGEYCESSANLNTHYEQHLKKEVESDSDED